jgi:hypothetical protein
VSKKLNVVKFSVVNPFAILVLLIGCSSKSSYNAKDPSWVSHLRTGEASLIVEKRNLVYIRAIHKDSSLDQAELCMEAMNSAKKRLKEMFPSSRNVSIKKEVQYFSSDYNDCSITVSIKRNLFEKLKSIETSRIYGADSAGGNFRRSYFDKNKLASEGISAFILMTFSTRYN